MAYSIEHNSILRDGEHIADITASGLVEFNNPELEKYRLPVWNLLEANNRIVKVEDGQDLAVWFDTEIKNEELKIKNEEEKEPTVREQIDQIMKEAEVDNKLVIKNVRQLREIFEKMTGEAAPFLSQSLGDNTPELWDYIKRHIDFLPTIKAAYQINFNLDKFLK